MKCMLFTISPLLVYLFAGLMLEIPVRTRLGKATALMHMQVSRGTLYSHIGGAE